LTWVQRHELRSHDMIHANGAVPGAEGDPERADDVLEDALNRHAGDWVAVVDDQVIDNDKKLGDLVERLNGQRTSAEIIKVS
jgi:Family of unknown function (DUF5678)